MGNRVSGRPTLTALIITLMVLAVVVVPLGALLSAIMSSADSSLLAASSLTTHNIIMRLFPGIRQSGALGLIRACTVVMAALSMGVALYVKQIYNLMVNSWATLFVGIFVPVTAALYWKKANSAACWASMLCGTGTWLGYIILKAKNMQDVSDPIFYKAAFYGGVAGLLSYIAATLPRYRRIRPSKLPREYPPE